MPNDVAVAVAIAQALCRSSRTLAIAESLTGGMLTSKLAAAPDAGQWLRGGVVAYSREVKYRVLDVPEGPVVSAAAARAMARGVARLLDADIAVAVTGVGGPAEQDGEPPGTVWVALALAKATESDGIDTDGVEADGVAAHRLCLEGEPEEICRGACTEALGLLAEHLARA